MPAGEIARHALPGQSAREQSAGATLAGRAPTTTGGGGGGMPPSVRGGGGRASLREGLPVRVTHAPSPAAGGGLAHVCETEAGWGAGWRDHLSGDLRGPGSPCFSHSPAIGEGAYFLCDGGGGWVGGGGVCMVYTPASRFPCAWTARDALWAAVAGSGDLAARGSAPGPAGVVPPAGVACPMGQGRSVAPRPAVWVTAARTALDAAAARGQGILPVTL